MTEKASAPLLSENDVTVRFAPSPNGRLHLGHVRSALENAKFVESHNGRFLLRIEDIDTSRSRPEFETGIYEDLAWLGLEWEKPVRRQSDHLSEYDGVLDRLRREGFLYPAAMSRKDIAACVASHEQNGTQWPRDPDGAPHYPGTERDWTTDKRQALVTSGDPFLWRLDMARALEAAGKTLQWRETGAGPSGQTGLIMADPAAWGDVILARRDTPASYHIAVVTDDALQGITHVIRGHDLFYSTAIHRLLQTLLGLPEPFYRHHTLISGPDGRKLSKSAGDPSIADLRAAGLTAEDVINRATRENG